MTRPVRLVVSHTSPMNSLVDKANAFISTGHPEELWPLLTECVTAHSMEALVAVQLLARDMYGGITFNFELKAPAAHCLPVWHDQGLDALVENALKEPTSKNFSLAFQILAAIASGEPPAAAALWIKDTSLFNTVSSATNASQLQGVAKQCLNRLVMSFTDPDEVALYIGTALQGIALIEPNAVKPLFQALSLRWTAVGLPQIAEYDALIGNSPTVEAAFHTFFERNPLFLDPLAIHVWSKPDFHGTMEPDFVVQRTDNTYLVVEIETPAKMLVTGQEQISAETTHAITQVLEYKSFLTQRFVDASSIFPNFSMPDGLVVIGLESSLAPEQLSALRRENEHRQHIRIMGFDALAARTRAITQNVIDSAIVVDTVRL